MWGEDYNATDEGQILYEEDAEERWKFGLRNP
jgi:hypothetical protein